MIKCLNEARATGSFEALSPSCNRRDPKDSRSMVRGLPPMTDAHIAVGKEREKHVY